MEKKLRLLILTNHFFPENFKCNDMAFELQKRGHEVSVMTAIPDYPLGKFYKGYGLFKRRKENINGVKVHRSCIIPRGNGKSFRLALNYLSYTIFATFKAFYFSLFKKYDAIIIHETSPIFVGIPALVIKKIQKIPVYSWILDLWPESLSAAGNINNRYIYSSVLWLTKKIYNNSDKILIGSHGFEKSICEKGDYKSKIIYYPNWVEEVFTESNNSEPAIKLPEGFNVMIAGNIGDAQDFPAIMEAMKSLKDSNINLIVVGDGRRKDYVLDFIKKEKLEKNVFLTGSFPPEDMYDIYQKADVLLMTLKDRPVFSLTVPSRLQAYMASGKPVVGMINGEGADLIRIVDFGWNVNSGDSKALASLLLELSKTDPEILKQKGKRGRQFSQDHFNFKKSLNLLESLITRS